MDELRVPKRRLPVEIVLPAGERRNVNVFLAEYAVDHAGAERLSDILNGTGNFIPAVDTSTDRVVFFNRTAIAYARVAVTEERDESDDLTIPTEFPVEVTLLDRSRIAGLVSFILPPDRARLADFLNSPQPFFRLLQQDAVALVNKLHVAQISTVD